MFINIKLYEMSQIDGVLFDLYGTLVNFDTKNDPYHELNTRLGLTRSQQAKALLMCMTWNFSNMKEFADTIKPDHGIVIDDLEEKLKITLDGISLFEDTVRNLERIKSMGKKIGLVSNLGTPYKCIIEKLGIQRFFDTIVFSCDVGFKKPQPQIYLIAANKLGIKPQNLIMTGDKIGPDVNGPKAVGANAVLLDRQDKSSYPDKIKTLDQLDF